MREHSSAAYYTGDLRLVNVTVTARGRSADPRTLLQIILNNPRALDFTRIARAD